jgi:catechol 2,3-dioxygenase-like lactoylglutathione lyase family enzyme
VRNPPAKPEGSLHLHLVVSDMKRSIDFYATVLGFRYDHGLSGMAWLKLGELVLTLAPGQPEVQRGHYFGWRLESVEALEQHYARLRGKRIRLSAPPDPASGRLYFFAYDPDDYPLCFSFQQLEREE